MDKNPSLFGSLSPKAEARSYDAPWYDDLAAYLTNAIYGEASTPDQYQFMQRMVGPANPMNFPAQATHGASEVGQAYQTGDVGRGLFGALELAGSLAPAAGVGYRAAAPAMRDAAMAHRLNKMDGLSAFNPDLMGDAMHLQRMRRHLDRANDMPGVGYMPRQMMPANANPPPQGVMPRIVR